MREAHLELPEAMGGPEATVIKILLAGLWWPTMTTNVKDFVRTCEASQKILVHAFAATNLSPFPWLYSHPNRDSGASFGRLWRA